MTPTGETPPNVLFVLLDELRADILGCYGHPYVQTPNMDRLAAEGVRFDRCWAANPLCIPARVAMMTSMYSRQTRVVCNIPPDPVPNLKELFRFRETLKAAGYGRLSSIGKVHTTLSPIESGFDTHLRLLDGQGATPFVLPRDFDPGRHHAVVIPGQWPNSYIGGMHPGPDEDTYSHRNVSAAIDALDAMPAEPWLLRVSLDRPHTPVFPPEPYASMYADHVGDWSWDEEELAVRPDTLRRWRELRGFDRISLGDQRFIRRTYAGLVTFVDAQIGRLLEAIRQRGLHENLLTVLIADHGCSIGDHGQQVKGPYATPDINRVPFIVHWPGRVAPGRTYPRHVQQIDLLPTLADLIDAPRHEPFMGRSLAGVLLDNDTEPVHQAVFTEADSHQLENCRCETVRAGRWRYTRYFEAGESELIDTEEDPQETRDVQGDHAEVVRDLEARLDDWRSRAPEPEPGAPAMVTTR